MLVCDSWAVWCRFGPPIVNFTLKSWFLGLLAALGALGASLDLQLANLLLKLIVLGLPGGPWAAGPPGAGLDPKLNNFVLKIVVFRLLSDPLAAEGSGRLGPPSHLDMASGATTQQNKTLENVFELKAQAFLL